MAALPAYREGAALQSCLNNYTLSKLLAANVPELFTVPTDENGLLAKWVTFGKGAAADFYAQAFDAAGATDRATNGTFAADTDWTKGTGWTIAAGVATATGAISTALSQNANVAYPLVQGQAYYVTYTATRSAGSVTINIGGTAGTSRSSAATFSELLIAGSTQDISFTTSGFSGTVDDLTVVPAAVVPGDTTNGVTGEQNPAGYFLNNQISKISIVSAGTPIITANFFK